MGGGRFLAFSPYVIIFGRGWGGITLMVVVAGFSLSPLMSSSSAEDGEG